MILLLAFRDQKDQTCSSGCCNWGSHNAQSLIGSYEDEFLCAWAIADLMDGNSKHAAPWTFKVIDSGTQLPECSDDSDKLPRDFDCITTFELHDRVMESAQKQFEARQKIRRDQEEKNKEDKAKIKAILDANPSLAREIKIT